MLQKYDSIIRGKNSVMFIKAFEWFQKFFFTLVLFLLTDNFYKFTNFLAGKPYIQHAVKFLTGTPIGRSANVFRIWWRETSSLSLDVAFWFIIIMLVLRPGILAKVRRMVWYNLGIFMLLVLACASWFWSIAPGDTLSGAYLAIKITLVGIYISQIYSLEEILEIFVGVIAIGGVLSIFVIWKLPEYGIISQMGMSNIWQGIYSYKNYMGRLMVFGNAMLMVYWLKGNDSIFKKILILGLFLLTGTLLIFSDSATSLLVLFGMYGVLVLQIVWTQWVMHWSPRIRFSLVAFGITLLTLAVLNNKIIFALFNRTSTMAGRVYLWHLLWDLLKERRLFGFGYASFWQQFPGGMPLWWEGPLVQHAHNGYVEIAMGLGLSGLIIFVVFLVTIWKRSFLLLSQNRQIIFFWPVLVLIYLTLSNITYSIAFEFPDFHWALFVIVAGVVTPSQLKSLDRPAATQNK